MLQTLEQKIRKHCPELMELSFGCKVKHKNIGTIDTVLREPDCGAILCCSDGVWMVEDTEIIGHPIHLEHILMAIQKSGNKVTLETNGRLFVSGKVFSGQSTRKIKKGTFDVVQIAVHMDIEYPLSAQSEETLKFINELID